MTHPQCVTDLKKQCERREFRLIIVKRIELNTQEEGSSSCRSSSSPSLGPSPVLLFLKEQTNKRQEKRESIQCEEVPSEEPHRELNDYITQQPGKLFSHCIAMANKNNNKMLYRCSSVKWQQQRDGKRQGCSITSHDGHKQELSGRR